MTGFLRQTSLVFRRELGSLLTLPLFYILTGIFFLLGAMIYLVMLMEFARGAEGMSVNVTDSVVRPTFHSIHFFLLFQIPLITMRVFAEDRALGMLDLFQTMPIKDWALLLGKFFGALAGIGVYIVLTISFPITTAMLGEVEWPVVIGSIIVLFLSAGAYTAVGLFFSALTESQVVAAVLSYVTIFLLAFGQYFAEGWQILPLQQALRHFTVSEHVSSILAGNIAPMNIVYFFALAAIFLFCTARSLESRRWRA